MFRPGRNERGFILISAIWLLILCGAIVAILMLRTLSAAREVAANGVELQSRATVQSVVETVFASILIDGVRSQWAFTPSTRTILVNGAPVLVTVTNEGGRIDVNEAPPSQLAMALQGLGIDARRRQALLDALKARRDEKRPLASQQELRAIFAAAGLSASDECVQSEFTVLTGFTSPVASQMSPRLAAALGDAQGKDRGLAQNQAGVGSPLRLKLSHDGQTLAEVVARVSGLGTAPVRVAEWSPSDECAPAGP